jgi:hypothetical protein
MSYRSSADGPIVKKGKTVGKCVTMKGDTIGGPTGGGYPLTPTTIPRDIKLPNGAKP